MRIDGDDMVVSYDGEHKDRMKHLIINKDYILLGSQPGKQKTNTRCTHNTTISNDNT